jgi:hypothetical protein
MTAKRLIGDGDTFELDGLRFRVNHEYDPTMREPWKEHDGHGVVSEWTDRDKRPGERVLATDRYSHRFYDIQASIEIAKRDGWGIADGEGKTPGQIAALAVERDYKRLKAWCHDEWTWIMVVVALLDTDGNRVCAVGCSEVLGGIEGDSGAEYLDEVARENAQQIAARFEGKKEVCIPIRE